jgi:hypothetical protein
MGLPDDWAIIEGWCRESARIGEVLQSHPKPKSYKYDGLDFTKKAEDTFWKNFPSRRLPRKPTTRINIQNIKRGIVASSKMWTIHEKTRAERAVRHLTRGAPAYQKFPLTRLLPLNTGVLSLKH